MCLLDVPVNKTTSAFTKPVDALVGEAVDSWQAVRPAQPRFSDRKTGELVAMLLAYRGARFGSKYINRVLFPMLCRKAGVPREDVRGAITNRTARGQRSPPGLAATPTSAAPSGRRTRGERTEAEQPGGAA